MNSYNNNSLNKERQWHSFICDFLNIRVFSLRVFSLRFPVGGFETKKIK